MKLGVGDWMEENIPIADSASNDHAADVVGNKTDTVAGDSVVALVKIVDTIVDAIKLKTDAQWSVVSKNIADLTGYDGGAIFTVTGDVMARCFAVVGATAITSTSGTTTLSVGTAEDAVAILAATTIDNAQFAATDVWLDTTPTVDVEILSADWFIIGGGADIEVARSADDITAGAITFYCQWIALSSGATVVSV